MSGNKYHTTVERRALRAFSFLSFLFFLSFFVINVIHEFNLSIGESEQRFAVEDPVPSVPAAFHLITFFIFLSLIRAKRFTIAIVLTAIYAVLQLFSLYFRVDGRTLLGEPFSPDIGFFEELYRKTWIWDYAAAVFVLVMLPWLVSLTLRMHKRPKLVRRYP